MYSVLLGNRAGACNGQNGFSVAVYHHNLNKPKSITQVYYVDNVGSR